MKPLKLEIEGVNSFREKQIVNFEALAGGNLFCISGKTGSGKTTILDCVILGLYERLPSFSSRGKIEDYINLRCEKAEIKLTFEADGKVYRTERVFSRKKGGNNVKLIDVESGVAIKEKSDDAFAFIGEKLGLDVDQFARVIILQQGEFARFLKATKADRNKMVINLFRLGRFDDIPPRFGECAKKLKNELENKDMLLGEYADVSAESLDASKARLKEAEKNVELADSEYRKIVKLRDEASEAEKKLREYDKALADKRRLEDQSAELAAREKRLMEFEAQRETGKLRVKTQTAEKEALIKRSARLEQNKTMLGELKKREVALAEKRAVYKEKSVKAAADVAAYEEARKKTDSLREKFGEGITMRADEIAAKSKELAMALDERIKYENILCASEKALKEKQSVSESLAKEFADSSEKLKSLVEETECARTRLSAAIAKNGAAALKNELKAGDVCPVCGEIMKKDPEKSDGENIFEKERAVKSLEIAVEKQRAARSEISARLERAKAECDSLKERINDCGNDLRRIGCVTPEKVAAAQKELEAAIAFEKAVKNLAELENARDRSESECRLLLSQGLDDKRDFEERKAALEITDEQLLEREIKAVNENLAAIDAEIAAFEKLNASVDEERKEIDGRKNSLAASTALLQPILNEKPVAPAMSSDRYDEKVAELDKSRLFYASERAAAANESATLENRLRNKRRIKAERAETNKKYERMSMLAQLFSRGEFNAFVATEYIKDFTFSASATLRELTGGKYSLSYDEDEGDFYVTDFLSGNEKRKAKTLSGGETFLASLSMAIALSQEIARFGTFDFFFIDEGFGTLHDAALDQVLEVLGKLSASSLVGLVTHRTELIGRIPVTLMVGEADEFHGTTCRILE